MLLNGMKVWWTYGTKPIRHQGKLIDVHETTTCKVVTEPAAENVQPIEVTVSRSHRDKPDREYARKASLSRALAQLNLPREERTLVWAAYNGTKPGGRWGSKH